MKKKYRILKVGGSYYVCIPKIVVRPEMIKQGVFVDVLDADDESITVRLSLNGNGSNTKHNNNSEEGGKNT